MTDALDEIGDCDGPDWTVSIHFKIPRSEVGKMPWLEVWKTHLLLRLRDLD